MWGIKSFSLLSLLAAIASSNEIIEPDYKTALKSTYLADWVQAGSMFDLVAQSYSLDIDKFDIHTNIQNAVVQYSIYTISGSHSQALRDKSKWTNFALNEKVTGQGKGMPTPLKSFLNPIRMVKGTTNGFYISLTSEKMFMSRGLTKVAGDVYAKTLELHLLVGTGKRLNFGRNVKNMVFNGSVYYKVIDDGSNTTPSPESSTACGSGSAITDVAGTDGQNGIMFDVNASNNIKVNSLDIHTPLTNGIAIAIYTKQGSHTGYERSPEQWESVIVTTVKGNGPNNYTPIGTFKPQGIESGATRAFYITSVVSSCTSCKYISYTAISSNSGVYKSFSELNVMMGVGVRYPFGRIADNQNPKGFNGKIGYTFATNSPTCSPMRAPTKAPIATPTNKPSRIPSASPSSKPNVSCSTKYSCNTRENCALSALFVSTNGCSWKRRANWLSGTNPCLWEGISCNTSGKVDRVSLFGNSMRGTLPTNLYELTDLTSLDLGSNSLYGKVPTQLGLLTLLKTVLLDKNSFTGTIGNDGLCKVKTITDLRTDCASKNIVCHCCTTSCAWPSANPSLSLAPSKNPSPKPVPSG